MAVIPEAEILAALDKRVAEIADGLPKPGAEVLEMIERANSYHELALICLTYRLPFPRNMTAHEASTAQIAYDAGHRASLPRKLPTYVRFDGSEVEWTR